MNHTQRGILLLVRSALTGERYDLPESFDMKAAYPEIRRHGLVTLAYEGAVRCGVDKALPEMQMLLQGYYQCLLRSERQMQMVRKIYETFDRNRIEYMPLKGCLLKSLYPKPELRLMGDADILIRTEQYETIKPLIRALGFVECVESDHELIWNSNDLHLELHKRLIPSYNKDYYHYFGDGWRSAKLEQGSRYAMTDEDQMIYLFTHFAKHYRDGGIGVRHVADLWVYRRAHPEIDEDYISKELNKLQLLEFYQNVLKLLMVWFEGAAEDDKTTFITEVIFQSGSWGTRETHQIATGAKNVSYTGNVRLGKLRRIWSGLFPNYRIMRQKYSVLQKLPVLLPLFWPVRWVTAVLFRRENLRRQKQDIDMITSSNIETYQQALHYVGLDFHFKE